MMKRKLSFLTAAALLLILLLFAAEGRAGAMHGLTLWGTILVPALLPFFAAAGLLMRLGLPEVLCRLIPKGVRRVLRLDGGALSALVVGLTGGYPLGAAAVGELARDGRLSRRDAENLLFFCDNTGPAYAVGAIGLGVFQSAGWGIFLWSVHALSALLLAFLSRGGRKNPAAEAPAGMTPVPGFAPALTEAVRSALCSILLIGAYVVLFSALLGALEATSLPALAERLLVSRCALSPALAAGLLRGTLELSSGIGAFGVLSPTPGNLAAASFLLGWGGLCVHLQSSAVTGSTGISGKKRLGGKLLQGALSAAITFAAASFIL